MRNKSEAAQLQEVDAWIQARPSVPTKNRPKEPDTFNGFLFLGLFPEFMPVFAVFGVVLFGLVQSTSVSWGSALSPTSWYILYFLAFLVGPNLILIGIGVVVEVVRVWSVQRRYTTSGWREYEADLDAWKKEGILRFSEWAIRNYRVRIALVIYAYDGDFPAAEYETDKLARALGVAKA